MVKKNRFIQYLKNKFDGDYLIDEPIARHTWYKIGGPADFFLYPRTIDGLIDLVQETRHLNMNTVFIGDGANILAHDSGFRGVLINLSRHINELNVRDESVYCSAGVLLPDIVLACEKNNLGGLEYMSGIPGTIGGALIMNAGTQIGDVGERVAEVNFLDEDFKIRSLPKDQINFKYRNVPELNDKIILGARFDMHYEKESVLKGKRITQIEKRAAKQPLDYPSCGSVFKRPPNNYVGKMVQELGLKGLRRGNAMISEKHGGFIVNLGGAKAQDVLYLIEKVQEEVQKSYSVRLEPELKFLGF